jgi:hypothetical protein
VAPADANEKWSNFRGLYGGDTSKSSDCVNLEDMFSYLDAATGSMIITAIAGGVAGLGVAVKMWSARIKSKLTGKPMPDFDSSDEDESASAHD